MLAITSLVMFLVHFTHCCIVHNYVNKCANGTHYYTFEYLNTSRGSSVGVPVLVATNSVKILMAVGVA